MLFMKTFEQICEILPGLLSGLTGATSYSIKDLTEGKIRTILKNREPVAGVYLMTDANDQPIYIGRSRNLAQRIGTDHRAKEKTQATLAYKLTKKGILGVVTMSDARHYMYKNFRVRMIEIDSEYARTIFEVYASMKLQTIYNTFVEH